jgi:hypothetical protein
MSTDLAIVSGELYLFPVDCLWDLNTREITYGVGKGTALSCDTLARFGLYERQVDGRCRSITSSQPDHPEPTTRALTPSPPCDVGTLPGGMCC